MRFLVAECTGPGVAKWLQSLGHDVFSAYDDARGKSDDILLDVACSEERILITNDRDFGVKIFRDRQNHCGVAYLRLKDERAASKIASLARLIEGFADRLPNSFVVVSETQVRFAAR
jgi:predicted nuclease of predicted toxin-antitoxin system